MLSVSEEVRNLFKTDRLPLTDSLPTKVYYIEVVDSGTIIDMAHMSQESLVINESICSDTELTFGRCESSSMSITLYNVSESLIGKQIRVYMTINSNAVPLGYYTVATEEKQNGAEDWKTITAFDRMAELDKDVTEWYKDFWEGKTTSTVAEFRTSFFQEVGFTCATQTLINDSLVIHNSLDVANASFSITGRTVAEAIGEINAAFGHIGRDGVFRWVILPAPVDGLYPEDSLYPSETLYPIDNYGIPDENGSGSEWLTYKRASYFPDSSTYQDFVVANVSGVVVQSYDGALTHTTGTQDNPLVVTGNFLTFGLDTPALMSVSANIYDAVKDITYTPSSTNMIGLPYLEVGDHMLIITPKGAVDCYIFKRTLSGIGSLTDICECQGAEKRSNTVDLSTTIEQITADLIRTKITFQQTSTGIVQRIETVEGDVSEVTSTANSLTSTVTNMRIGGRNYITKKMVKEGYKNNAIFYEGWNTGTTASGYGFILRSGYDTQVCSCGSLGLAQNTDFIVSFVAWTAGGNSETIPMSIDLYPDTLPEFTISVTPTITKYTLIFNSSNADMLNCSLRFFCNTNHSDVIAISAIKLEEGNRATAWSPAPEDQVDEAEADAATKYSTIEQTATQISTRVAKGSIISEINQSAETVTIDAARISLTGKTFNLTSDNINISSTNFNVDSAGNMSCNNATINGVINAAAGGNIAGLTVEREDNYSALMFEDSNYYFKIFNTGAILCSDYNGFLQGNIRMGFAEFRDASVSGQLIVGGNDVISLITELSGRVAQLEASGSSIGTLTPVPSTGTGNA